MRKLISISLAALFVCSTALADRRPDPKVVQYRSDAARTGVTSEDGPASLNTILWQQPLIGPVRGLIYDDGAVYAGSSEALYAFNANDGSARWVFSRPGVQFSPAAIVDDVVYVGGGSTLYALDRATGTPLSSVSAGADISASAPLVADGTVYVGAADGTVVAVDAATAAELWRRDVGTAVTSHLTLGAKNVLIVVTDSALLGISARDGAERWSIPGTWNPAASDGQHVYAGKANSSFYALDVHTGRVQWTFNFSETTHLDWTAPVLVDGSVIVANDLYQYRLDAATGARQSLDQSFFAPRDATVTPERLLYLGDADPSQPSGENSISVMRVHDLQLGLTSARFVNGFATGGVAVGGGAVFLHTDANVLYAFAD